MLILGVRAGLDMHYFAGGSFGACEARQYHCQQNRATTYHDFHCVVSLIDLPRTATLKPNQQPAGADLLLPGVETDRAPDRKNIINRHLAEKSIGRTHSTEAARRFPSSETPY